jgi:hypothetical protein
MIICISALIVMGQMKNLGELRAKSFIVVDDAGRKRAELGMDGSPGLAIYDEHGGVQIALDTSPIFGSRLGLYRGGTYPQLKLEATEQNAGLYLYSSKNTKKAKAGGIEPRIELQFDDLLGAGDLAFQDPTNSTFVNLNDSHPSLIIADEKGYSVKIGSSDPVTESTGHTHRTSAASIVMFKRDSKRKEQVIWKAP